jgi:hypothetical protein
MLYVVAVQSKLLVQLLMHVATIILYTHLSAGSTFVFSSSVYSCQKPTKYSGWPASMLVILSLLEPVQQASNT